MGTLKSVIISVIELFQGLCSSLQEKLLKKMTLMKKRMRKTEKKVKRRKMIRILILPQLKINRNANNNRTQKRFRSRKIEFARSKSTLGPTQHFDTSLLKGQN